jgi:hypothetical protein
MPQALAAIKQPMGGTTTARIQVEIAGTRLIPVWLCQWTTSYYVFCGADHTPLFRIILYAITGCVSALFCVVIISGVRANSSILYLQTDFVI